MILFEYLILLVVRVLIGLMYILPWSLALWLGRFCIRILRILMWRAKDVSLRNLELVFPESSREQRLIWVEESFKTLAGNLVSYAKLPSLKNENLSKLVADQKFLEIVESCRLENPDVGVLFPTAHMGYFEMCVQICCLMSKKPISILARGFDLPVVDKWWNKRRQIYGCKMFDRRGGFRKTIKLLKSGQDVCMLFDQNVKRNHAIFVDFFGIPSATTKTVALAAIRTGAPICFITSYRTSQSNFNVVARRISSPASFGEDLDEQIHGITRELHQVLEEVIRAAPGQWFWLHRRFKTRPKGEKEDIY